MAVRERTWEYPTGSGKWSRAWIVDVSHNGKRIPQETFESKKAALKREREIKNELDGGIFTSPHKTLTVAAAIDEYIGDLERRHRLGDCTFASVMSRRAEFKRLPAKLTCRKLTEVSSDVVQQLIDELRERYAARTVIHSYRALTGLLNFCVKRKWIARSVLHDEPAKLPKSAQRTNIPTVEDLRALFQAVWEQEHAKGASLLTYVNRIAAVHLCLGVGLRSSETYGLHWEDLDYERRLIHVRRTSTALDGPERKNKDRGRNTRRAAA
jgi:integrase